MSWMDKKLSENEVWSESMKIVSYEKVDVVTMWVLLKGEGR